MVGKGSLPTSDRPSLPTDSHRWPRPSLLLAPWICFLAAPLTATTAPPASPESSVPLALPTPRPLSATIKDGEWTGSLPGLEPNPHKTFNLDLARPGTKTFETKKATTSKFSFLKLFGGSREFPTSTYNTREFLPKISPSASKSFSTNPFPGSSKPFAAAPLPPALASRSPSLPANAPGANRQYQPPLTPDATRNFAGQEVDRMKSPLPPGGGPNSGVMTGRQLTVEEVKAILNKSK